MPELASGAKEVFRRPAKTYLPRDNRGARNAQRKYGASTPKTAPSSNPGALCVESLPPVPRAKKTAL